MLKIAWSESLNWERQTISPNSMKVLPVNFSTEHKQMLSHLSMLVSEKDLDSPRLACKMYKMN